MDRRSFLQTSALATAAGAMGLSLPRTAWAATPPKRWVFINLGGGWDSTYVVDPKPQFTATVDTPPGIAIPFGTSEVWNPTLQGVTDPSMTNINRFFADYGSMTCIVRGIQVRSIAHTTCAERIYTGRQGGTSPDMPTMIGFETAKDMPVPFLSINGPGWAGPLGAAVGRVGETGQLRTLIDPNRANFPLNFKPSATDEVDIENWHLANAERLRAIRGSHGYNKNRIVDFEESLLRADMLRDRGKNLDFGGGGLAGQLATAASAFELGLSAVAMVDSGYGFDTHGGNIAQGPAQDAILGAVRDFLTTLSTKPGTTSGSNMLDETVVVIMSEMTRTPKLNGGQGKDHWPVGAALLVGAGVAGGTIVGDTGEGQVAMPLNLKTGATTGTGLASLSTEVFVAGMLQLAGVDSSKYFGSTPALTAIIG